MADINENKKKIIILGLFDSVHIGHRYLIDAGKDLALTLKGEVVVYTFDDNFYNVLNLPRKDVYLLKERLSIFDALGVKYKVLPTNADFFNKSKEEFIEEIVQDQPYCVVAGSDYRFGKGAEGDAFILKTELAKKGIFTAICDMIKYKGAKISTTDIAQFVLEGEIKKADVLLGSPFFVTGTVINGLHNGKIMGFPTANFDFDDNKIVPKFGVYVTKTFIDDVVFPSVTNVGPHPTFDYDKTNCETHVIGYEGDLYGKEIKVEFIDRIRDIVKFADAKELSDQLKNDVKYAKEVLKV